MRTNHFALCNGRRLAIYNVEQPTPIFDILFEEFEFRWADIERHLAPKYLIEPELRKLRPDFGFAVSRLGMAEGAELIMIGTRLSVFARLSEHLFTATVNTEFADRDHCVSFDFKKELLPVLVAGLPDQLRQLFLEALSQAPFQAGADLMVEVDLRTHLGEIVQLEHEAFVPLVIDEVLGSRFNPIIPSQEPADFPEHFFRLSKVCKIVAT